MAHATMPNYYMVYGIKLIVTFALMQTGRIVPVFSLSVSIARYQAEFDKAIGDEPYLVVILPYFDRLGYHLLNHSKSKRFSLVEHNIE